MSDMRIKFSMLPLFVLLISARAFSQGNATLPVQTFSMEGKTSINLGNMMGRPFMVNNFDNIKGTPFFIDSSFRPAHIMLSGGKFYSIDKLRLNLLTHQLHFLTPDNNEMVAGEGIIKKVIFYRKIKDSTVPVIFANGYPSIDKFTELNYYEELNQGKIKVLRITDKTIAKDVSITASPLDKHFEEHTNYYLFNVAQNKIMRWRKGEEFILGFISDKTDIIKKFITDKNSNCRSIHDIVEIIDYYNAL